MAKRDPRYAYEAYEFLMFEGLPHTQRMFGKVAAEATRSGAPAEHHVTGTELVSGLCDLAKLRTFWTGRWHHDGRPVVAIRRN